MFRMYLAYKVATLLGRVAPAVPYIAGGVMAVQAGAYVAPKLAKLARENMHESKFVQFPVRPQTF